MFCHVYISIVSRIILDILCRNVLCNHQGGEMIDMEELRRSIPGEEFDYQSLLGALKGYERPRDKITALFRRGVIIRVKKGIYVFGQRYARRPFSREVLANMIYGPSYVSLDYALHYYGLIPERVEAVTSVSVGRNRRFTTPVGLFILSDGSSQSLPHRHRPGGG